MAARLTENDQIQFLLSCVRHSNNGQVDFDRVVAECQIISKGAAAKRLSRLFGRYPVTKTGTGGSGTTATNAPKPVTGEEDNNTKTGQKSGRSGKGTTPSPTKKSSSAAAGGVGGTSVVGGGGVGKKTTRGKKGKTAAAPTAKDTGSAGEGDGLLDGTIVKTEEAFGDGLWDHTYPPFFSSDA